MKAEPQAIIAELPRSHLSQSDNVDRRLLTRGGSVAGLPAQPVAQNRDGGSWQGSSLGLATTANAQLKPDAPQHSENLAQRRRFLAALKFMQETNANTRQCCSLYQRNAAGLPHGTNPSANIRRRQNDPARVIFF
jgi:hypothetical protein